MTRAQQDGVEALQLPRIEGPASRSLPPELWLAADAARDTWRTTGTAFCDDAFVTDGRMILRVDRVRGPLPDWLEHSPCTAFKHRRPTREMVLERFRTAVEAVDEVLRHPTVGTPIAGGPTLRYETGLGVHIYLSGARVWLASAATGAVQLWAPADTDEKAVVAARGPEPVAVIMPIGMGNPDAFVAGEVV